MIEKFISQYVESRIKFFRELMPIFAKETQKVAQYLNLTFTLTIKDFTTLFYESGTEEIVFIHDVSKSWIPHHQLPNTWTKRIDGLNWQATLKAYWNQDDKYFLVWPETYVLNGRKTIVGTKDHNMKQGLERFATEYFDLYPDSEIPPLEVKSVFKRIVTRLEQMVKKIAMRYRVVK